MIKCSVADKRYLGSLIGGGWFLLCTGVVLYAWATSIRPEPDRLASIIIYYFVLCVLALAVLGICYKGFTYRWTEVNGDGLIVHEGYYGLIWKSRIIPKSQITAVECYDDSRPGLFTHVPKSGIRICLNDSSAIVLAESDAKGNYHSKVIEMRRALGLHGYNC
jgi:hypothetical protein